jgi:protein-disulfide isomerase
MKMFKSVLGSVLVGTLALSLAACNANDIGNKRESTRDVLVFVTSNAGMAREKALSHGLKVKAISADSAESQLIQALLNSPGKEFFVAINPAQRKVIQAGMVSDKVNQVEMENVFRRLKQVSKAGNQQWSRLSPQTPGHAKLVVFSDFQCPYCKMMETLTEQWQAQYGDKLEVEMVHFPLPSHEHAFEAAEAAECARAQGRFDEYKTKLFERQDVLSDWTFNNLSAEMDLKQKDFVACRMQHQQRKKVRQDQYFGEYMGINGTPSVFLNGEQLTNITPDQIQGKIQEALTHPAPVAEAPKPAL